jgi:hypothetical protein
MKAFWITYAATTLALLAFCYSFLGVLPLCGAVTAGAAVSSAWLYRKRAALAAQKHPIAVALIASFASVASGVILIFAVAELGALGPSFMEGFVATAVPLVSLAMGLAVCVFLGRGLFNLNREGRLKRRWAALLYCFAMIPLLPFPLFAVDLASNLSARHGMTLYHGDSGLGAYFFPPLYMLVITGSATVIFLGLLLFRGQKPATGPNETVSA